MAGAAAGTRRVRPRILVVYQYIALYRLPVFQVLARSSRYDFVFMAGAPPKGGTVRIASEAELEAAGLTHVPARNVWLGTAVLWQRALPPAVLSRRYDAVVALGDIHYLSTWASAAAARILSRPVLFWSHGIKRRERGLARLLKSAFFRLPRANLVYDAHAPVMMRRHLGLTAPIEAIWNSLDFDEQTRIFEALECAPPPAGAGGAGNGLRLVSVGRLNPRRRLDLVLEALAILSRRGVPVTFEVVGDGPERAALEAHADWLGLRDAVTFRGAIYEEAEVAAVLYHADLLVSPGPIGLPAVHAHGLGCPVLTIADRTVQMPEVEVITPGETGILIDTLSAEAIAEGVLAWREAGHDRATVRRACRAAVAARWTPEVQARLIEDALARHAFGSASS